MTDVRSSSVPPRRSLRPASIAAVVVAATLVAACRHPSPDAAAEGRGPLIDPSAPVHVQLFAELQPVPLANCRLRRFGERHDGGYLLCANLLGEVAAGYSYGISGYDGWGCEIATRLDVAVHQYDCFDPTRPACGGRTIFHDECVAGRAFADDEGRPFDTIEHQLARNGHAAHRVVMKMDVEGAEWESLLAAPDEVLARVDQLAIGLHGVEHPRYLEVVRRLKTFFHVAHLHFNNYRCLETDALAPFPADVYEVLFVNRRIGRVDPGGRVRLPHPEDAPNAPDRPDCQRLPPPR